MDSSVFQASHEYIWTSQSPDVAAAALLRLRESALPARFIRQNQNVLQWFGRGESDAYSAILDTGELEHRALTPAPPVITPDPPKFGSLCIRNPTAASVTVQVNSLGIGRLRPYAEACLPRLRSGSYQVRYTHRSGTTRVQEIATTGPRQVESPHSSEPQ